MVVEIVRDSCLIYGQLSYEQLDRLINGKTARLLQQKELEVIKYNGLKICPKCQAIHPRENELCQSCQMNEEGEIWDY